MEDSHRIHGSRIILWWVAVLNDKLSQHSNGSWSKDREVCGI